MPKIVVRSRESLEQFLRRFKRTVEKSGLLGVVRRRMFHQKKSAIRKRQQAAAVKRLRKRLSREALSTQNRRRRGGSGNDRDRGRDKDKD